MADDVVSSLDLGRHHPSLPIQVRSTVAIQAFGPNQFYDWLTTSIVYTIDESHEAGRKLQHDLGL
jgi:hypothetical protein